MQCLLRGFLSNPPPTEYETRNLQPPHPAPQEKEKKMKIDLQDTLNPRLYVVRPLKQPSQHMQHAPLTSMTQYHFRPRTNRSLAGLVRVREWKRYRIYTVLGLSGRECGKPGTCYHTAAIPLIAISIVSLLAKVTFGSVARSQPVAAVAPTFSERVLRQELSDMPEPVWQEEEQEAEGSPHTVNRKPQ